ncbi:unnamed protein product [Polarella glacialis]|uniref:Uncharacterized protein n=1 Tax=Polarella glacialis TaxID=89957 RepID=A0A813HWG2_POLGL|nr:unnamed protein product [Polarella glacialis]
MIDRAGAPINYKYSSSTRPGDLCQPTKYVFKKAGHEALKKVHKQDTMPSSLKGTVGSSGPRVNAAASTKAQLLRGGKSLAQRLASLGSQGSQAWKAVANSKEWGDKLQMLPKPCTTHKC